MHADQLASFLRSQRQRLSPDRADRGRRRTPGLRREEVAERAGISIEYYTRLEQARGAHPSRHVLSQLDRALQLSPAARTHLYALAGEVPDPPRLVPREPPANVRTIIEHMSIAAIVVSAAYDVIAWNPLAVALLGDYAARAPSERNLVHQQFLATEPSQRYCGNTTAAFSSLCVTRLQRAAARYPDDLDLRALLCELSARSPAFNELWEAHQIRSMPNPHKTMNHARLGLLHLVCDVLIVPEVDQEVVMFLPAPGSESERKWPQLLRGRQLRAASGR